MKKTNKKPKIGDFKIVEETLKSGKKRYDIYEFKPFFISSTCSWNWLTTFGIETLEQAKNHVKWLKKQREESKVLGTKEYFL